MSPSSSPPPPGAGSTVGCVHCGEEPPSALSEPSARYELDRCAMADDDSDDDDVIETLRAFLRVFRVVRHPPTPSDPLRFPPIPSDPLSFPQLLSNRPQIPPIPSDPLRSPPLPLPRDAAPPPPRARRRVPSRDGCRLRSGADPQDSAPQPRHDGAVPRDPALDPRPRRALHLPAHRRILLRRPPLRVAAWRAPREPVHDASPPTRGCQAQSSTTLSTSSSRCSRAATRLRAAARTTTSARRSGADAASRDMGR